MTRGTVALILIVVGVVLIVGATLASTVFLITPDPNLGGIVGIVGVLAGLVAVIAGILIRRSMRR